MDFETIKPLLREGQKSKIVLLVMDGLGGLPMEAGGKTELETARTPNMDALAAKSILGLHHPLPLGMTPGSGAAIWVYSAMTRSNLKLDAGCSLP